MSKTVQDRAIVNIAH